MTYEHDDEPGWWSEGPLGGREEDMSPASRTAMGGDPAGMSGRGATEPEEEGLGAAVHDALDDRNDDGRAPESAEARAQRARTDAQRDMQAARSNRRARTTDAQPSAGEDQLGLTGQTGPSARGGLAGDQTDLGGDRQGLGGPAGPATTPGAGG